MFGINQELYDLIFGNGAQAVEDIECRVLTSSTSALKEEGVEEIRERAPHWFKMNNRLVTKEDYEFYIMNEPQISSMFNSVKVMNNWEYASTFYRWLNQLGVTNHEGNARYYLNPARFTKYGGASLADAVDSNNVYIWYITNFEDVDDINYDQMVQRCKSMMVDIKDLDDIGTWNRLASLVLVNQVLGNEVLTSWCNQLEGVESKFLESTVVLVEPAKWMPRKFVLVLSMHLLWLPKLVGSPGVVHSSLFIKVVKFPLCADCVLCRGVNASNIV